MMRVLPFGAVVGLFIATMGQVSFGQISSREGQWVLANGNDIATKTADFMKAEYGQARESAEVIQNADLVRLVTDDPSSWRFYSRDRGILVAVDAGSDVSRATYLHGPGMVARSIEAIIRQERGLAIKGHVTVIFIDPALRELDERCHKYTPTFFKRSPSEAWGAGIAADSTQGAIAPAMQACGCR